MIELSKQEEIDMTIKNGDMPAMPISDIAWLEGKDQELQELTLKIFGGMTKREQFAMAADVSGYKINDKALLESLLGHKVDMTNPIEAIKASLELETKLQVMKADALLKALEE